MGTSLAHAILSRNSSRSTIHWLQSVPTPLEQKNLGTLFGVLEIESNDSRNDDILNTIGEELHNALYSSEHFSTEAAFEVALQKTNKKIQEMTRTLGDEWLQHFNALIGVVVAEHVYFSHVGSAVALLLYKGKLTELVNHTKAKLEIINPVKVFQDTIAGEVMGESRLFFSTESIYDYFSQEKLRRVLSEGSADDVVKHIENSLVDAENTSLACAVITPSLADMPIAAVAQPALNHVEPSTSSEELDSEDETRESDSMSRLLNKEYQTSQTLSGSLWSNVKSSLQKTARTPGHKSTLAMVTSRILEACVVVGGAIMRAIRSVVLFIIKKISRKDKVTTYSPRLTARNARVTLGMRLKALFGKIGKWFMRLTAIQKSFVLIAIVVCVIVLSGIFNQGNNKISKQKEQEYASALSQADSKINEAKAAMLYDKNRARTLLQDAETLVESVPKDSKQFSQGVAERMTAISEQLLIANGVKVLGALSPLIDFSAVSSSVSASHITLLGSSIYAFDSTGGRVYRGNLDTKEATVVIAAGDQSVVAASQASVGTVLTALSNQTLGLFKPVSESVEPITTSFPATSITLTDARIFSNRLYTLDTQNGQIYKHTKNAELSFSQGSAWITDSTDIHSAVSFAIDGSIYVLKNTGEIVKLSGGKKDNWSAVQVDPALSSGVKIVTDENTTHLYVLDSTNSRVVVFAKDGSLVGQYQSTSFAHAKDMLVDESKKTIYVLSDNAVYTITIE